MKACTSGKIASQVFKFVKGIDLKASMFLLNASLINYVIDDIYAKKNIAKEQGEINDDL